MDTDNWVLEAIRCHHKAGADVAAIITYIGYRGHFRYEPNEIEAVLQKLVKDGQVVWRAGQFFPRTKSNNPFNVSGWTSPLSNRSRRGCSRVSISGTAAASHRAGRRTTGGRSSSPWPSWAGGSLAHFLARRVAGISTRVKSGSPSRPGGVNDSGGSSGTWLPYFLTGNFDMRRRQLAYRTRLGK